MLLVVDMMYGWALVGRGSLSRDVSLYRSGSRKLRHDQVCVLPVEGVV